MSILPCKRAPHQQNIVDARTTMQKFDHNAISRRQTKYQILSALLIRGSTFVTTSIRSLQLLTVNTT
jgi:hypothetical protein